MKLLSHTFPHAGLLTRMRRSRVVHNIMALYGTQIATFAFPLIVTPYLARILGPSQWGVVALAQAVGAYFTLVVDFGFTLSATRRIARSRDDQEKVEQIVAGVMGAKIILALMCICSLFFLQHFLPIFREHSFIMWEGAISGIAAGFSMLWFYQGMEEMKTSATMEIVGRGIAAAGVFIFIHRKEDAWKVLAVQMISFSIITTILFWLASRKVRLRRPTRIATITAFRESASMFLFKSAVSLYTTANTLILGMEAAPFFVGLYSGSERITKTLLSLTGPISQTLYPRLSRLILTDTKRAVQVARASLGTMALLGFGMGAALFLGAPLIVHLLLGHGFDGAVPVLRILSLLLPCIALNNVLGMQWMLPLGMDGVFNKIIISGGVLNVILAFCLASRLQHIGMAWAVVGSETFVTVAMAVVLVRAKLFPFFPSHLLEAKLKEKVTDH